MPATTDTPSTIEELPDDTPTGIVPETDTPDVNEPATDVSTAFTAATTVSTAFASAVSTVFAAAADVRRLHQIQETEVRREWHGPVQSGFSIRLP